jgi:hypothetical protein
MYICGTPVISPCSSRMSVPVYVYTCMYVCMYVCSYPSCVCVWKIGSFSSQSVEDGRGECNPLRMGARVHIYVCVCVSMHVQVIGQFSLKFFICMYVCVCIYMYICMHVWNMGLLPSKSFQNNTCIYVFMCVHIYLCMYVCRERGPLCFSLLPE